VLFNAANIKAIEHILRKERFLMVGPLKKLTTLYPSGVALKME
jgi:hypothetical protein